MSNLSRRKFLITAAGSAAGAMWLAACGGSKPSAKSPAAAGGAEAPEVNGATLGFIALTDASPLIIAKEKGFFAKHGMRALVHRCEGFDQSAAIGIGVNRKALAGVELRCLADVARGELCPNARIIDQEFAAPERVVQPRPAKSAHEHAERDL